MTRGVGHGPSAGHVPRQMQPRMAHHLPPSFGSVTSEGSWYSRSTNFIAVLSSVSLLMAAIVIGIIGYNFSYYKGSYRTSLFHSELTLLVVFCAGFVSKGVYLIAFAVTRRGPPINMTQSMVGLGVDASIETLGSMFLLIQLAQYGRYFVEQYEIKIFAGVFGIFVAVVDAFGTLYLYRTQG